MLRRTAWSLAVVLPVLALGWVVFGSSLLAVQHVLVRGEGRLTEAQVVAAAGVADGTPLARVDTAAVARRVRALGAVASVTVSRGWPHALRITVVERQPVVAVPQGARVLLLDRDGVAVGTAPTAPKGVLRLDVSDPSRDDPTTAAALTVLRGLPRGLAAQLAALKAGSPEQVTLLLRGGRTVLWGGDRDGAAKAAAVLALLKMPGTVFDVSAPGVATRR
jgi:cell division protein FtsQ